MNPTQMAAKLYDARDTAKVLLGERYPQTMQEYGAMIDMVAAALKIERLAAMTKLATQAMEDNTPFIAMHVMAAAVELEEPSIEAARAPRSIIAPLRPIVPGWVQRPQPPAWVTLGFEGEAWYHPETGIGVISAVEVAKDADGIDRGPEYHISISKRIADGTPSGKGVRVTSQAAQEVLRQFGLDGAEEDNHVPSGIARNFWRPVADGLVGMECACKADEPAIREDKGDYVWRGADHA